jgi:hypothetical protein
VSCDRRSVYGPSCAASKVASGTCTPTCGPMGQHTPSTACVSTSPRHGRHGPPAGLTLVLPPGQRGAPHAAGMLLQLAAHRGAAARRILQGALSH